ncbi:TPA: hypothetical protein N0F65_004079 [Lagenidium giganteum]|uniref:B box-type domain-containing protein n=1 Tax=Lagenidium giganteum TaxID=4803 RepID=A0AAV2Z0W5_9STRA|nr:TPA: hypothetical protein N0F65_004079 [Lagenidium giganteum]
MILYGISWSRCYCCLFRLKNGMDYCENCKKSTGRTVQCKECTTRQLGFWCFDCDAYFCERCHANAHVTTATDTTTTTGSSNGHTQGHRAFTAEGASGKTFVKSAWSADFLAMCKAARRMQLEDANAKKHAEAAANQPSAASNATSSSDQNGAHQPNQHTATPEPAALVPPAVAPTATASAPAPPVAPAPVARAPSPVPTAIPQTAPASAEQPQAQPSINRIPPSHPAPPPPPTPSASSAPHVALDSVTIKSEAPRSPSRKRKLPTTAPAAAPAQTEGLSLYERVRRMHDQLYDQAKPTPTASRPPTPAPTSAHATAAASSQPAQAATSATTAPPPSASVPSTQPTQPTTPTLHAMANGTLEAPPPPPPPVVDLTFEDPGRMSASGSHTSGMPGSMDPLTTAVENEYNRMNLHVFQLEQQLAELNNAVVRVSLKNVAMAASLNQRIGQHRTALQKANVLRNQSLAKMIIYSPELRAAVRELTPTTLFDVPHVLTACHKQCLQLGTTVRSHQENIARLRKSIEDAISSGDAQQLLQLQHIGQQIQTAEQQLAKEREMRSKQILLMVQYSRQLRDTMQQIARAQQQPSSVNGNGNANANANASASASASANTNPNGSSAHARPQQ